MDVGFHLGHVALQSPEEVPERARDARQFFRADDDQRHDGADHHLAESDIKHKGGSKVDGRR